MVIKDIILRSFQDGKIETFYADVYPSLLTYAVRFLGDDYSFLAEDCVQDAVFKAYGLRMQFTSPTHFKSYLYTCVHNNAMDILRKNKSHDNYMQLRNDRNDHHYDMESAMIEQETLDMLYDAIEKLPEEMQRIFELSFEYGLKNAEVAEELGISESMVKKRKMKMIRLLRESFKTNTAMQLLLLAVLG